MNSTFYETSDSAVARPVEDFRKDFLNECIKKRGNLIMTQQSIIEQLALLECLYVIHFTNHCYVL